MMTLKVTKKESFTLSSDSTFFETYSQGQGVDFLLNETSLLAFAELGIFHSF